MSLKDESGIKIAFLTIYHMAILKTDRMVTLSL